MRLSIRLVAALVLLAAPALAQQKTEITETGKPHFEAELPSGAALRLHIRSGEIRVVGSDENRIVVDITGKHAAKTEDVKYRLTHIENSTTVSFRLSGGPTSDFQVSIRIPRNSDLFLRVPAGDVEVRGIGGHKDVELHAGDLTVEVGSPENYAHTDASVKAGELDAAPFGVSKGGLFRSFRKEGPGKLRLHVHVGAGGITLI